MRKYVWCITILLLAMIDVKAQAILDTISQEACVYLTERKLAETNADSVKKELEKFFIDVSAKYYKELEEVFDPAQGGDSYEQFGEMVAMKLVNDCPYFIQIAMLLAEDESNTEVLVESEDKEVEVAEFQHAISGELAYLVFKENNGRDRRYLWLTYFEGANMFKDPETQKGIRFKIYFQEIEIYNSTLKDYINMRMLLKTEKIVN